MPHLLRLIVECRAAVVCTGTEVTCTSSSAVALPHHLKGQALSEAGRMLAPGGRLLIAEFHRPEPWVLRALSWTYFKVFEPLGLAIWDTHDPLHWLENAGGWTCERTTYFFGNFQIITATKY